MTEFLKGINRPLPTLLHRGSTTHPRAILSGVVVLRWKARKGISSFLLRRYFLNDPLQVDLIFYEDLLDLLKCPVPTLTLE